MTADGGDSPARTQDVEASRDNADWDAISYVISSRYRVEVLGQLVDGPAIPSELSDSFEASITHVSRALSNLQERDLVVLLVSEERKKGRVYATTAKGERVWNRIEAENLSHRGERSDGDHGLGPT